MATSVVETVIERLVTIVQDRFERRRLFAKMSRVELVRIKKVAEMIVATGYDPASTVRAFLDHRMPVVGQLRTPWNIKDQWRWFKEEQLQFIAPLFPLTEADDELLASFLVDWQALAASPVWFSHIYTTPITRVVMSSCNGGTSDMWRVLAVIRQYQPAFRQAHHPLFTLRSYLAAQIEKLSPFVDRVKIGNLLTEKAAERYEDWYDHAFYEPELVTKAHKRPSANNPVCTSAIRVEYELQRIRAGSRRGIVAKEDETPLLFYSLPLIYQDVPPAPEGSSSGRILSVPPSARE